MVKIDISATSEFTLEISASDLDLNDDVFSDIHLRIYVKHLSNGIQIMLDISANALLECDRTLRTFVAPLSNSYELLLFNQGHQLNEDDMMESIQLDPQQRVFDATDVIRDVLMLAVPPRNVAPDAEDIHIQTIYGAPSVEADHRWSPLLAVRDKLTSQ